MSRIRGRAKEAAMKKEKLKEKWHGISEDMIAGMSEWREKHPRATLREIEIDKRLSEMRRYDEERKRRMGKGGSRGVSEMRRRTVEEG
jgi:hypothetical protein